MGVSKVVVSIATLHLLLAGATRVHAVRTRPQATAHRVAHDATKRQAHEVGMVDIDSEMSAMLFDAGVIREDTYNKPSNKYTLKIDSGKFERSPWLQGTFKFGGAYGGLLAGGTVGGLPGMLAGGAGGMAAGDRAAETLSRILQGQGSIGISEDWKDPQPKQSIVSQIMATNGQPPSQVPAVQKEATFLSSVQQLLGMGKRSSPLVNSIVTNTSRNSAVLDAIMQQPSPPQQPLFLSKLFQPYLLMETTDRNVITGLDQALHSEDHDEVDDAKVTATLLEILRHSEPNGVEVVVE